MVPVKNMGELKWYEGCHYTRKQETGTLTISQKMFGSELARRGCVTCSTSSWCKTINRRIQWGWRGETGHSASQSIVCCGCQHRRRQLRCSASCREIPCSAESCPWKATLSILEYVRGTSEHGITYQRGMSANILLEVFADADDAFSRATDRRLVSGGAIMGGSAYLCWFSRTLKCVTLSISEVDYVVAVRPPIMLARTTA